METKQRILIVSILLSSLIPYLEWGNQQCAFLFQAEVEVFSRLTKDPFAVLHPFTILPIVGQALLLLALFFKSPPVWVYFTGIVLLGFLVFFIFIIGLARMNLMMVIFSLPFCALSIISSRYLKKKT